MGRIRSYACNLLFRDRPEPIVDSENRNWVICRYGKKVGHDGSINFSNPSLLGICNKGFSTMKVTKPSSYIQNTGILDLRKNWRYTISLRYRIDRDWISQMVKEQLRAPGLCWDNGSIMLYDHRENTDGVCLSITMGEVRIELPIDYEKLGSNTPTHLLIGMDRMQIVILINGVLYNHQYHKDPTFVFHHLKMGNYLDDEVAVVEFDEFCIIDDFIYTKDFKVPTKPFHSLYPEIVEEDDARHHIGVATNGLIRANESNQDYIIKKLDIVRHVDYEPPLASTSEQKRKYEYQYEGLEDDVASYKR